MVQNMGAQVQSSRVPIQPVLHVTPPQTHIAERSAMKQDLQKPDNHVNQG